MWTESAWFRVEMSHPPTNSSSFRGGAERINYDLPPFLLLRSRATVRRLLDLASLSASSLTVVDNSLDTGSVGHPCGASIRMQATCWGFDRITSEDKYASQRGDGDGGLMFYSHWIAPVAGTNDVLEAELLAMVGATLVDSVVVAELDGGRDDASRWYDRIVRIVGNAEFEGHL